MLADNTPLTLQRHQLIQAMDALLLNGQANCVLAIIDIRDFRELNHSFGIDCGDSILAEIADRLGQLGIEHCSHYYLGNDEFAILFARPTSPGIVLVHIENILDLFREPFSYSDHSIKVTVNCGVANNFSQHSQTSQLLFDSELALNQAKANNRPYVWLDQEERQTSSRSKWHLLNSLHRAIEDRDLALYWQPKIALSPSQGSKQYSGAEALIRWETADQGVLAPKITLPLIEHLGSEIELIEWLLNMALRQLSIADTELGKRCGESAPLTTASVNIPPSLATIRELEQLVQNALSIWNIEAKRLTLEITEEVLITDKQQVFDCLTQLRQQGVRISIDDFGTGYSSLAYFKHIPADELKIDQSFIHNMHRSDSDRKIVSLIIDIAHTFGLDVVAEGVELQQTADMLKAMGCDYAQGFLFCKPVPHVEYLDWLQQHSAAN